MALLTVTKFKEHFETDLATDALQRHLDEAEAAIIKLFGAHADAITEWFEDTNGRFIFPGRPVSSITSIVETVGTTDTTLSSDDYEIQGDGRRVRRLIDGTNGQTIWSDTVKLIYVPVDDTKERDMVQLDLVKLEIQFKGLDTEKIGDWSGSLKEYETQRREALRRLSRGLSFA